jgi:hypothetical protein
MDIESVNFPEPISTNEDAEKKDALLAAMPTFRPHEWTPVLKAKILIQLAGGVSINDIFAYADGSPREDLPPIEHFYLLLTLDPDFRVDYQNAVVRHYETLADSLPHIVEHKDMDLARLRVLVDVIKYGASRLSSRYVQVASNKVTVHGDNNFQVAAAIIPAKKGSIE